MAFFIYLCKDCLDLAERIKGDELTYEELELACLFETSHMMNPSPGDLEEARTCPRCDSVDTEKTYFEYKPRGYVLGNGFLDRDGTRRAMNVYKLDQEDPYAHMREPGEVDELKAKFKRAGTAGGNEKHYPMYSREKSEKSTQDMDKAVKDVNND